MQLFVNGMNNKINEVKSIYDEFDRQDLISFKVDGVIRGTPNLVKDLKNLIKKPKRFAKIIQNEKFFTFIEEQIRFKDEQKISSSSITSAPIFDIPDDLPKTDYSDSPRPQHHSPRTAPDFPKVSSRSAPLPILVTPSPAGTPDVAEKDDRSVEDKILGSRTVFHMMLREAYMNLSKLPRTFEPNIISESIFQVAEIIKVIIIKLNPDTHFENIPSKDLSLSSSTNPREVIFTELKNAFDNLDCLRIVTVVESDFLTSKLATEDIPALKKKIKQITCGLKLYEHKLKVDEIYKNLQEALASIDASSSSIHDNQSSPEAKAKNQIAFFKTDNSKAKTFKDNGVDVTDLEMTRSPFAQSDTAKLLRNK